MLPDFRTGCKMRGGTGLHFSCTHSVGHPDFFRVIPCDVVGRSCGRGKGPSLGRAMTSGLSLHCRFFPGSSRRFVMNVFCGELGGPVRCKLLGRKRSACCGPVGFNGTAGLKMRISMVGCFG